MSEPIRLWSVTTLIKLALGTSQPLVNWVVRTTAEAAVNSRRTVETMLADEGAEAAIDWLCQRRYQKTGRAKIRGSDVHRAAEALALGMEAAPDPVAAPYVEQYRRWLEAMRPTFVMSEAPVYNVGQHYAGTLDGIIELGGRTLLFDIKTTEHPLGGEKSRPPYPEVALQLVAYARATEVGVIAEQRYAAGKRYYLYDEERAHAAMPSVDGALAIIVSPFDCVAIPVRIDAEVWRAFLHVRECARWQLQTGSQVFGPPLGPEQPRLEVVA